MAQDVKLANICTAKFSWVFSALKKVLNKNLKI